MAGGIDWFRWHHGSVTDPKFQLVARKAGVSLPDVLAVWAFALEKASASDVRGEFGELDCEAIDCLFGLEDGKTAEILTQMGVRGLVSDGRISKWEERQPKREREDNTAAERKANQRARDTANKNQEQPEAAASRHVTPSHATSHQKTPRGEERREEEINTSTSLRSVERAKPRATRKCPDSFEVSEDLRTWAMTECPQLDLIRETAKFRDHAFKTAHSDWDAAWRNWMRKASEYAGQARASPIQPINRQEALEARNRSVAQQWLQEQGAGNARAGQAEILNADH